MGLGGSDSPWPITGSDGTFVVEHVPAGRLQVFLMVALGPGQFTNSISRDVEVGEGDTVSVEFTSREVLLTGRVTRSGGATPGIELNLQAAQIQMSMMIAGPAGLSSAAQTGPQRNRAVTREDGSFELLLSEPGRYNVMARAQGPRTQLPSRVVEVPDAEVYALDLDYSGVVVAGQVVDADTRQPVEAASVTAAPASPGPLDGTADRATASTGPDGRFELLTQTGEYSLDVSNQAYMRLSQKLNVGDGGVSDLRLELKKGKEISGRVVNVAGQGVAGVMVAAVAALGPKDRSRAFADTRGDGGFRLQGLSEAPYSLCATAELSGFAIRTGVRPGARELTLTLQPGGRVRVLVLGPDGAPFKDTWPQVVKVDGAEVEVPLYGAHPSDATGHTEVKAPAGALELVVSTEKAKGRAAVTLAAGQLVDAEIRLTEPPDKP